MSKIACIGVGTVGAAWAVVFARAGYDVALYDSSAGVVDNHAMPSARRTLQLLSENGLLQEPVDTVFARLHGTDSVAKAVEAADYVQESVREDISVKREVFAQIAAAAPAEAILASSTSAIPGSEFLADISGAERALVAHPVNPPSLIPLVELCGTGLTSTETLERAKSLLQAMGMRPIILRKEIDGFILNRLQFTLVAEALHLVGEGYCTPEDIDAVLMDGLALRWASIGPFEVAHLNAPDGVQGFVDRLGPMMKRLGTEARTDYDWTNEQIASIHAAMSKRIPLEAIADRQEWRDQRILALRRLKLDLPDPVASNSS